MLSKKANYHCNGYILETDPLINKSTLTMTTTKPNSKIKPKQINKNITTN